MSLDLLENLQASQLDDTEYEFDIDILRLYLGKLVPKLKLHQTYLKTRT